jgi:hypothetical protein
MTPKCNAASGIIAGDLLTVRQYSIAAQNQKYMVYCIQHVRFIIVLAIHNTTDDTVLADTAL